MKWTEVGNYDAMIWVIGKTIKSQGPVEDIRNPGDRVTWFTDGTALAYKERRYSPGYSEYTPSWEDPAQFYKGEPE